MNYNMTGSTGVVGGYSESINIPGTIVGTLKDVSATNQYLKNAQRYNNYLTSNYGAAQEASDRYMTLKERIPMSIEYYLTPSQKKEVVMYINPNKISVNTQKLKAKVVTRGGIYFHHYGDDVWTMTLTGETGLSNMKGIEALEEVYHYSGALLKYQGITQQTVHTNNIGSATGGIGSGNSGDVFGDIFSGTGFGNIGESVTKYLNDNVTSVLSQGLGNKYNVDKALKGGGCFDGVNSALSNSNLTQNMAGGLTGCFAGGLVNNAFSGINVDMGQTFKQNLDNVKDSFGNLLKGFDKNLIGTFATETVLSQMGMGGQNPNLGAYLGQLSQDAGNAVSALSNLLSGVNTNGPVARENVGNYIGKSTQGNFYVLGHLTTSNLNYIVNSVQQTNNKNLIDHGRAAQNWSDMEDHYTDLYRPRQIFIYFDDRVFIGHFDSFNWTRQATTKSIAYDMKFTICRQVIVQRNQQGFLYGGSGYSGSGGLGDVLTGLGMGILGGAVGSLFSNSGNVKSGTSNTGSISAVGQNWINQRNAEMSYQIPGRSDYTFTNPNKYGNTQQTFF